ncbi:putative gamma-glutamylcyclotransferase At3g02910 [Ziziphus jujuba]|uniref:Gamma-glutamylcyclotransferase family protein n=2 Tax=Ziziphus jujuba TaxID=326968 RepID=A0A6P4ANM4_ZIZJJ|nr:putative gamma-glutamylcyclotransferase At3g02910 [Ziziphus jujuba]XP_048319999.1 putative gamma-glutamylcyclotransferase At3g02910 [Ziziphus jujuba]KAH7514425.1 hypothetical protein FEM48_Zijuj11G0088300 [Ziziphus jujuba var. spinosa]
MADNNSKNENDGSKRSLIFSYGTLKRGLQNNYLLQELIDRNDAVYLGSCLTHIPYPLVIGPYGLAYIVNFPGNGHRVKGELYSVSARGLARLDELEATSRGHYERLPIRVVRCPEETTEPDPTVNDDDVVEADAYYAHRSFGEALWDKNHRQGLREYSEKEARLYVRPEDRPNASRTIVDDIWLFISSSETHQ